MAFVGRRVGDIDEWKRVVDGESVAQANVCEFHG